MFQEVLYFFSYFFCILFIFFVNYILTLPCYYFIVLIYLIKSQIYKMLLFDIHFFSFLYSIMEMLIFFNNHLYSLSKRLVIVVLYFCCVLPARLLLAHLTSLIYLLFPLYYCSLTIKYLPIFSSSNKLTYYI